jgi:TRAP-type mannitol/chloroaromatic compound transport system permease small subunit
MLKLCDAVDRFVRWQAMGAACLIALIALVQVVISVLRYFYSYAPITIQELIPSLNVALVSASISYAILRDVHTRVDILTERIRQSQRVGFELALVLCLLCPTVLFLVHAFMPYVAQSWASLEGSRNVGGLGGIYVVKSFLLAMSVTLVLQAVSFVVRILMLRQWPYPHAASERAEA